MFEYIFKNYKNFPLEIDDPQNTNQKIPNPQIKNNNDVYQYFTKELHLTFLDPTIKDVTNEYLKEYFTIAVLKINRDLSDYQLSTETKWNTLSNDDKLHLRNAICLLIKFIFEKGNDSFQTNKNYSVSPISVNDINQFLKFEYSVPVISELEQVSVFFLQQVLKKREIQLEYDDRFFKAVRATFLDLFIDEYPATAGVLVSKLLSSKDFEEFIKQHAKGPKGDKGDPGDVVGGAGKTNELLTFDPTAEGGINQYVINKDNKDNRSAVQNRLISNENKILSNENKINQNDINIRNNRSNVTNARNDIANNRAMIISNVRQTSTNTVLTNQNKTRLDNLSNIGSVNDFIKFNDTNIEFWNQGKKIAEWFHASTDVGVHLIKFFENLSMSNNKITDLSNPVFDNDAANKKYVDDAISVLERGGIDVLTDKSKFGKRLTQNSQLQEKQKLRVFPADLGIVRNYRTLSGAETAESSFRDSSMDFYSPGIERVTYDGNRKVNPAAFVMTDLNNLDVLNNQILIIKDGTFEPETQRNYPSIISNFKPIRDRDIIRKQDLDEAISKIPSGSGGGGSATFKNRQRTDLFDFRLKDNGDVGFYLNDIEFINLDADGYVDLKQTVWPFNGLTLNDKKIRNLGPGTEDKDATNLKQVKDLIAASSGGGGDATFKNGAKVSDVEIKYVKVPMRTIRDLEFWQNGKQFLSFNVNDRPIGPIKDWIGVPSDVYFIMGGGLSLNNTGKIELLKDGVNPQDAVNKRQLDRAISNIGGGIKKFTVVVKNIREPYIVDNTTGENITLSTRTNWLKTQIELNFSENSIINNSRWKVLGEFVPTAEDIQNIGNDVGDFITIAGLIVPNDPSPLDNAIYLDVQDPDFDSPGTTFNSTQYHIAQQKPENRNVKWDYTEYQTLENLFMLIHYPKYDPSHWDQPHLKRKFKMDFESQYTDNKRNNFVSLETEMKNQGKLYLIQSNPKIAKNVGIQKIDIMTKINVEHANNKSDIQNLKIYFQKMTGNKTVLTKNDFEFIEPGDGTKLTFILEEKYDEPTTTTTTTTTTSSNGYDEDSPA